MTGSAELPQPLVPAEVDLRDFQGMWIDTDRLLRSDTWVLGTGDEKAAAMTLWLESWHQVPAASLPSNDRMLAKLSQADRWPKVKEHALRGWVLCSDGRRYHPVVAEKALEAWIEKLAAAISGAAGNAKRWQVDIDTRMQREQLRVAADLLRSLNPASRTFKKKAVATLLGGDAVAVTRAERLSAARQLGTHTEAEWQGMLAICSLRCVRCRADGHLDKDHILPLYRGGSDSIDNLQPLCPQCNTAKGPEAIDYRRNDWRDALRGAMVVRQETHRPPMSGDDRPPTSPPDRKGPDRTGPDRTGPDRTIDTSVDFPLPGGGAHDPPVVEGFEPSAAALVTRRLREAGIARANPTSQRLIALVEAGATADEFMAFADRAIGMGDPFAYVLGCVEGERKRAKRTSAEVHNGRLPSKQEAIEQRNRAVADEWLAQQGSA